MVASHFLRLPPLTTRCRHYFLKHLAGVVNGSAKRKHDVGVSEKGTKPADHEHRSAIVTGVTKRLKPRSARAVQRTDDEESRSTPSPDCTSGVFHSPHKPVRPTNLTS